jgi:uracil-DNA glycosylase
MERIIIVESQLHKKPSAREIAACRPWLDAELGILKPRVIVCLGATTAEVLLGRSFRVTKQRGQELALAGGVKALATHHPAAVLRAPDASVRRRMR